MSLLSGGESGSVMCVWNNCPPYYIPDTSMALFILFTTCAMIFRYNYINTNINMDPNTNANINTSINTNTKTKTKTKTNSEVS